MRAPFQPSMLGGPWTRRLAPRRAWVDGLPWDEPVPQDLVSARWAWTQTAHSEYAAAASFSAISAALAAAGAPIDLVALTSDFVVDEIVHVEVAARIAAALGGGVNLEVDLERLVRPPTAQDPGLRAAELIVRTSCVGEVLTVPLLDLSRRVSDSELVSAALRRIMKDEVPHAQLGGWFLEWADGWLDDGAREHLGRVAGGAVRAFTALVGEGGDAARGGVGSTDFNRVFADTVARRVAAPLVRYGIRIPSSDLAAVGVLE